MSGYQAYRFYSPAIDGYAQRLSMVDARGGEFYMIVPAPGGRKSREARNRALDLIEAAIAEGRQPGEVTDYEGLPGHA